MKYFNYLVTFGKSKSIAYICKEFLNQIGRCGANPIGEIEEEKKKHYR